MARMTMWVTDDLEARMDTVKGVNWSKVAADAFERKLKERDMGAVIRRLRETLDEDFEKAMLAGYAAGWDWACETATADQLKRCTSIDHESFRREPLVAYRRVHLVAAYVYNLSLEDDEIYKASVRMLGEDEAMYGDDDVYLEAFISGAIDVWDDLHKALRNLKR